MADRSSNQPLPLTQRAIVTVGLALGVFMNVLDVSIANVSIPTISGDLGVSSDDGTWIITSFSVANAVAVPISGWLARQVGEVRLFVVSTLLFTLFSVLCGFSSSFPMLLIARILQGATAGPMIPLSQSLLLPNYPTALQVMLDKGNDDEWFQSPFIITNFLIALIGFSFFTAWELTEQRPIVDLRLFGQRPAILTTTAMGNRNRLLLYSADHPGDVEYPS